MASFKSKLKIVLAEMFDYRDHPPHNTDPNRYKPREDDAEAEEFDAYGYPVDRERVESSKMFWAPLMLWTYYLAGYKKTPFNKLPYLINGKPGEDESPGYVGEYLSDGRKANISSRNTMHFRKDYMARLKKWLDKVLGRDVGDMKVYEIMRKIRQYTEMPQRKIENITKNPWTWADDEPSAGGNLHKLDSHDDGEGDEFLPPSDDFDPPEEYKGR